MRAVLYRVARQSGGYSCMWNSVVWPPRGIAWGIPPCRPPPPHLAVASVYARTRVLATALRIPDDKFPVDPNGVLTAQTELPNYVSKVVCFYVDLYIRKRHHAPRTRNTRGCCPILAGVRWCQWLRCLLLHCSCPAGLGVCTHKKVSDYEGVLVSSVYDIGIFPVRLLPFRLLPFAYFRPKSGVLPTHLFYTNKPISGCHFDIALMHKYHFVKSRRNTTFWAKVP